MVSIQPKIELMKQDLSDEKLKQYLAKDLIAVDCEMMGLNLQRDRLCLVQIGDEDRDVALVQIIQGQTEAPNLKKLMEATKVRKLFHFARTDVAVLRQWLDINVDNFFCTKIASKLARTYSDRHSLREIVKELLDKEVNKAQQQSDWGHDELTKSQQQYAASDVYHLIPLYEQLMTMLEREGRTHLAESCSEFIKTRAELDIMGYEDILEH